MSKKDKRHAMASPSTFHFPGFTSSDDDEDDDETPMSLTKPKPPVKRRISSDLVAAIPSKKTKQALKETTNRPRKQQQDAIRKKLDYTHQSKHPFNSPPAEWNKPTTANAAAPKQDTTKERLVSFEFVQDPPMMRRIPNPAVVSELDCAPPSSIGQELESPFEQEEDDLPMITTPKWSKPSTVSNKRYMICSMVLLLAYAVPFFRTPNKAAIQKPQGTKNQSWKRVANTEHNVFYLQETTSTTNKQENEKSSFSSYFSFY